MSGGPINFGGSGEYDSPYNTYGLSTSFLEGLGIQGPLYNKIFIANVSILCPAAAAESGREWFCSSSWSVLWRLYYYGGFAPLSFEPEFDRILLFYLLFLRPIFLLAVRSLFFCCRVCVALVCPIARL